MATIDKEEAIVKAVKYMKNSAFKLTGIKVELEAVFNRGRARASNTCNDCSGTGRQVCEVCDNGGGGCDCDECIDDRNNVNCPAHCNNGLVACDECGGGLDTGNFANTNHCGQWLLRYLSQYELAEFSRESRMWVPKHPLVFTKFYPDASVDSELTFTLALDKAENILLLPRFIEAWNALGEAIGEGINVDNAGMHMALINNTECYYPSSNRTRDDLLCFSNFKKSMSMLMPALYFLGSTDEKSRSIYYRVPQVDNDEKYSAVHYYGDALEFRVFNTCYDNPEAILDNVVVMKNCMRYWRPEFRDPGMSKIASKVQFGNDEDDTLERFYVTVTHLDLLNAGLKRLKPAYYSLGEVKKQRNFGLNKRRIDFATVRRKRMAEAEYEEYESRFDWNLRARRSRYTADLINNKIMVRNAGKLSKVDEQAALAEVETEVEALITAAKATKKSLEKYVQEKVDQFINRSKGEYTLYA
jgi:hypothetical protein